MPHVGPTTEVDQRSTAVDGGLGLCDLVMDDTALELVVLQQTRENRRRIHWRNTTANVHLSNPHCSYFSNEKFSEYTTLLYLNKSTHSKKRKGALGAAGTTRGSQSLHVTHSLTHSLIMPTMLKYECIFQVVALHGKCYIDIVRVLHPCVRLLKFLTIHVLLISFLSSTSTHLTPHTMKPV